MTDNLEKKLHVIARSLIDEATERGEMVDKKLTRYNDMVETAIRYGQCSSPFNPDVALGAIPEVVRACVIGDPMHTPKSRLQDIVPDWMIVSPPPNPAYKERDQ